MEKVVFIIPYFGKFNNYFQLFLNSCAYNKKFEWHHIRKIARTAQGLSIEISGTIERNARQDSIQEFVFYHISTLIISHLRYKKNKNTKKREHFMYFFLVQKTNAFCNLKIHKNIMNCIGKQRSGLVQPGSLLRHIGRSGEGQTWKIVPIHFFRCLETMAEIGRAHV